MAAADGATAGGADDASHNPALGQRRLRHTRARTGCERCRAQHRKCDEEKPRCKRCTDAGVECRYLTNLSFLEKNFRTLSHETVFNTASAPAPLAYPTVEFVASSCSAARSKKAELPSTAKRDDGKAKSRRGQFQGEIQAQQKPFQDEFQHPVVDHGKELEQPGAQGHGSSEFGSAIMPEGSRQMSAWANNNAWPLVGQCSLSQDESRLLRHYSHHVAPWLDVYDLKRTFGLLVPRFAMMSPCVMDAVLQLSAASADLTANAPEYRGFGALSTMPDYPGPESALSALRLLAHFMLLRAKQFIKAVPDTWTAMFHGGGVPGGFARDDFVDVAHQQMWLGSVALMSRLEIAYSLMYETVPAVSSDFLRQVLVPLKPYAAEPNGFHGILNTCLRGLALLSDVMSFCLAPPNQEKIFAVGPPAPDTSRDDAWKALLEELWEWQTRRPTELQALLDTEDYEAPFPTILFTSSAGVSANMTYHAAMLLLFESQPHAISLVDWHSTTRAEEVQMSPLWHARRVCGIALNSDLEHTKCWDPCLIAAFSLAARRISRPAQQAEILACLDRVRAAGWRIDGLVRRLCEHWGRSIDNQNHPL